MFSDGLELTSFVFSSYLIHSSPFRTIDSTNESSFSFLFSCLLFWKNVCGIWWSKVNVIERVSFQTKLNKYLKTCFDSQSRCYSSISIAHLQNAHFFRRTGYRHPLMRQGVLHHYYLGWHGWLGSDLERQPFTIVTLVRFPSHATSEQSLFDIWFSLMPQGYSLSYPDFLSLKNQHVSKVMCCKK